MVSFTSKDGTKKAKKPSFISVWRRYLLDCLRKDSSMYPKLRDYNFYTNGNATMSGKDNICFYYTIDGYPTEVPIDFRNNIRRLVKPGARVSFISTFEPTVIDWESPKMKSRLRTWKNIAEDSEEVTAYNYNAEMVGMDSRNRREASLVYLSDATRRRNRNLFKYRTLMVICGVRGSNFDKTVEDIMRYCNTTGFSVNRIDSNLLDFLQAFSPFSMELNSDILKEVGNNTIPDEQIARFCTYDQGKIGTRGLIFGTDIYSGFSVYKVIKKSYTDAENILITGETGSGKSFYGKALFLQLLAYKFINGTINDIEGFEYIPMAGFISNYDNVVILNMAEGQGCYYDPFEIVLTGISDVDKDMFVTCSTFAKGYLSVLVGDDLANKNVWGSSIISSAISKAYSDIGVDPDDMSTWSRTKGYDLYYVYSKFIDLYNDCISLRESSVDDIPLYDRPKLNDGYLDAMDKIVARLAEYFEPFENGGFRCNVFKHKVSLTDIVNAKLVICSFGMAGRSPDTIDPIQMNLSQLSAANISYIRSIYSKAMGMFNFKVWEEFQRWGSFPGSEKVIKTAITGGRKLGDINFILTNNPKDLLDDDRFAIFDNITSFAIGAIAKRETRHRLCDELSIPLLKDDLDKIVTGKGKKSASDVIEGESMGTSMYNHAFLVHLDKVDTTIAKMILPVHIANSKIFATGVDLEGNV